jgi:ABC-type transport system substrate-binding protein
VQTDSAAQARSARTLNIVLRGEPADLVDSASSRNNISLALFGAGLVDIDDRDDPYPVLAETVPQLNSASWQLFPDGRMETTYRLREGLVWHDGVPLTAEDMVFAQRVNAARIEWGLSVSAMSPVEHRTIDAVLAPDPRTVVIRWRQAYAPAVAPEMRPLPRHLLEATLDHGQPELLGSHSYGESLGGAHARLACGKPRQPLERHQQDGMEQ